MSPSSLALHSHSLFAPRRGPTINQRTHLLPSSQRLILCASSSSSSNLTVSHPSTINAVSRIGSLSRVSGVLGCQWGDEGKGKLVDILAHYFNIVARCQVFFFTTFSCSFWYKVFIFGYIFLLGIGIYLVLYCDLWVLLSGCFKSVILGTYWPMGSLMTSYPCHIFYCFSPWCLFFLMEIELEVPKI